jgi:hypothetical protein
MNKLKDKHAFPVLTYFLQQILGFLVNKERIKEVLELASKKYNLSKEYKKQLNDSIGHPLK